MLTVAFFLNQLKYAKVMLLLLSCFVMEVSAQEQMLDSSMHYVSNGNTPEWEEFNNRSPVKKLIIQFQAKENLTEQTLQLRQYDVKQSWQVLLNGNKLGNLVTDINDMLIYMAVPFKTLRSGVNIIHISLVSEIADDILVGQVVLHPRTKNQLLHEGTLHLEVLDKRTKSAIPSRITITNSNGILQTVAATAQGPFAVRPGTIYSLNGKVSLSLPAGNYTIYAGRGFEYSVDSIRVNIKPGEQIRKALTLTQEVPTEGWISSDTHIHTVTYSGHGDASVEERALTIAGEGIELPVITDHNIKVDIARVMKSLGVDRFCTPINGMEFTTNLGHFNVFPVNLETPVPQHQLKDWNDLGKTLDPAGRGAVILNHARDIHAGFSPFDPKRHVSIAGMDLIGWKFPANAMEVLNSGSLQTNMFYLFQDWFGMMNRGHFITPVGSSDSHDVSRYLVGQARTYIRSSNNDPGKIDIDETLRNFRAGKVAVSMGLLTEITINNKYGAGELAPPTNEVAVSLKVMGPGWTSVNRISLYANGKKIREALVTPINFPGVKWKETWVFPKFKNDVFLVAIAEGPYIYLPFWPLVKPFQPRSPKWTPAVVGSSGAVWIDSDGDGEATSAYTYAADAWKKSKGNIHTFIKLLNSFDEAIAVQAASILLQQGMLKEAQLKKVLQKAHPNTRSGFQNFLDAVTVSSSP